MKKFNKVAALTGGTGFLGRYVAQALEKQGYQVRMLARSLPVHPQLQALSLDVIPGSLMDDNAVRRLVAGVDLVVHCAGLIRARTRDEFMRINGEGTSRLADLWVKARQDKASGRFVHISSLAAREPHLSDYAASKAAGEEALQKIAGDWLILRPAAIYGPWDTETLPIFQAQKWPVQPLLAGADARVGLIHVEDVARAVVGLGEAGETNRKYDLCDHKPEGYSWTEIVSAAAQSMALQARPLQMPEGVVRVMGRVSEHMSRYRKTASVFNAGKAREILHADWTVDPARIPPNSLWEPTISLDQGFADTTSWYRAAGWL